MQPVKLFEISDEEGHAIQFWVMQDATCTRIQTSINCSHTMTQDDFLDALQYFIDEVVDKGVEFLDTSGVVKH
jgi:hypothetical protein